MKKSLFVILLQFVLISHFIFAQGRYEFSTETGVMSGIINEYVFDKLCLNINNKVSELDWDVISVPYANVGIRLNPVYFFYADVNAKVGMPKISGKMQDYDWLNSGVNNDPTELTNFSEHTNILDHYYSLIFSLGFNFALQEDVIFSPFISYEREDIFFHGINGYKTYKSENWERKEFDGKVISYKQVLNSFSIGASSVFNPEGKIEFFEKLEISPFLCFIDDYDFHWINRKSYGGTLYNDKLYFAFKLNMECYLSYRINRNNKIGLKFDFEGIPEIRGITQRKYINPDGEITSSKWTQISGEGGTNRLLYDISVLYKYSF